MLAYSHHSRRSSHGLCDSLPSNPVTVAFALYATALSPFPPTVHYLSALFPPVQSRMHDALLATTSSPLLSPVSAASLDDLHAFDPATMTWTLLSAADRPSASYDHGFTSAGGRLYVHGGYHDSDYIDGEAGVKIFFMWRSILW